MNLLNIKYSWFAGVFSNRFCYSDMTKKLHYQKILKKEHVQPENVYVFGDSYKTDLQPAEKMGMNTYLIKNATCIPSIVMNALQNTK